MPPATLTTFAVTSRWLPIGNMAQSPPQDPHSPYFASSPGDRSAHPSGLSEPRRSTSRPSSGTQYEFIMQTGDESAAAAKQKLKTVRSHVMKNYLHQQHREGRGSGDSSLAAANSDRRKGKERARSIRSPSRESSSPKSPAMSEDMRARSGSAGVGPMFSGSTISIPFAGGYAQTTHLSQGQPFALDFNFVAPPDEASTFAQLYANCVVQDRKSGLLQPSFETLNAKGETMRIVQDTIAVCGNNVPESIIFAVCLLAFGCSTFQEWDESRGHVEALQRLLDMRGGVQSVDFELQKTLTWATYSLAASLRLPPRFPVPRFTNVRALPLAFHDDAQIRAWRTVKRFPKNASFVFDIVVRFHQLGLATSSEWYNEIDQRALSNLYFETMHSAVTVQLDEPWDETLPSGVQGQEAATMFKVWVAGLPLFVWATARHVKNRTGLIIQRCHHDPIFARLKAFLDGAGGYHAWPRGKSLEPVLATLFYVVEACDYGDPWRVWCVDTLRKVCELLKFKKVEEFRKALEFFPMTEEHRATASDVWDEMIHGSVRSTPTLTFSTIS